MNAPKINSFNLFKKMDNFSGNFHNFCNSCKNFVQKENSIFSILEIIIKKRLVNEEKCVE